MLRKNIFSQIEFQLKEEKRFWKNIFHVTRNNLNRLLRKRHQPSSFLSRALPFELNCPSSMNCSF